MASAEEEILRRAYEAFNARDVEAVLVLMHPEVDWPNGMEGGRVRGHAGVRDYWQRQFGMIDSRVEPRGFETDSAGRVVVDVHQVVRDPDGELLSEGAVQHVYSIRDGLIERMEIVEEPPETAGAEAQAGGLERGGPRPAPRPRAGPPLHPRRALLPDRGRPLRGGVQPLARRGAGAAERVVAPGELDLERLCEEALRNRRRPLQLRFVGEPLNRREYRRWRKLPRERLDAGARFTTTGMFGRLVDAGLRASLLLRGKVAAGLAAAAEITYRERLEADRFTYYGRVFREGGYVCLQYWFFYAMNDWRSTFAGINDHEADWEMITVYLGERRRRAPRAGLGRLLLARRQGRQPAPPLGRPRPAARGRSPGGLRRRRLALGRLRLRRLRDLGRSAPAALADQGPPPRPAAAGSLARRRPPDPRLRHPLRRLRARRRPGDRPGLRARLGAGADRRRDPLGARLPRPLGARHRGPLRRRAGAGRAPLRARRLDPPILGEPARLGRAAEGAAHRRGHRAAGRAGRGDRVGAARARRARSPPAAAPSAPSAPRRARSPPTTTPRPMPRPAGPRSASGSGP